MSTPFIGQLSTFGFTFAPRGWAPCDGQILAIQTNTALFSLLGTTYGGNGQTNFALPNLQSRVPIHRGQGPGLSAYVQGQAAGAENVTLTTSQIPQHTHAFNGTGSLQSVQTRATTQQATAGSLLARSVDDNTTTNALPKIYVPAGTAGTQVPLGGVAVTGTTGIAGGGSPHTNIQPYLTLLTCIALEGIFPSRN